MQAIKKLAFALLFSSRLLAWAGSPELEASNTNGLAAEIRHEEGPGLMPADRVYVNVGTNHYAFVVPAGLRIDPSAEGQVVLRNDDYSCFVSFRTRAGVGAGSSELSSKLARELLLNEQPDGEIAHEFSMAANNQIGPAFDVEWVGPAGQLKSGRFAFIPGHDQVLEFAAICSKEKFALGQRMLQTVVLTFRGSGADGKVHVAPLSDKL